VWALGCIILQFITGKEPFAGIANEITISVKLFRGDSPLNYALTHHKKELLLLNGTREGGPGLYG